MKKAKDPLCEIIFKDPKLGILTSRIGRIDQAQLKIYSMDSNDFIIFKERYNSPILKQDIKEIVIHQDNQKISINEVSSRIIKFRRAKNKGKIS